MTPKTAERAALHSLLAKHPRVLLTTHINPDGDGLGSEAAMALWLRGLGKQVAILNDSPTPAAYHFLARHVPFEVWEPELAERRFTEADLLVVLDTSNRQRIGRLAPLLDRYTVPVAVVDHHVSHAHGFGQVNVIEPEAAATGEIVYELMREAGAPITADAAEALYVAVMTDTGSFKYSNTDPPVHRMAAELLSHGLDPHDLFMRVNAHASAGRMRFFGEVLGALETDCGGRLVVMEAAPEQFTKHGLQGADTDGLIDLPRNIEGAEIVVLFSEVEPGKVKVSLRSNGKRAIDDVATRHGGGGHPHAAGVLMRGTRADVKRRILGELRAVLERRPVADEVAG